MTAAALTVRPAAVDDATAMAEIYNEGIADRVATFETTPRTPEDVLAWFDGKHPAVVVVDAAGQVVGYAVTFAYADRCCYAGVAEFSVYVRRSHRGQGVGVVAMKALIAAAEDAGFWKLLSRVFVENRASLALLRSVGFREVGVHEKHGKLDGVWRDVVAVERIIEANLG
ncbi:MULTISPECIES: arsinothricin resistance N-acetyltransferase ArsN1 family A [unclassified Caulobacter]|jgi:phosphinothricin acetyltransferase|uniref:arsinothricin resistance N-acetyltransferase ArsN1 family A n=1 Tax=unclassified Caulobacter TaxID=2648921 RepID=UPI000780E663|nr:MULTISPECIES: arsinothricin resistance N-acetyltransferase ArsN1 family A [unclassified Caulobacter]AZS21884.1 N-acetyltransferase [Caulobacter sp. FWC26]